MNYIGPVLFDEHLMGIYLSFGIFFLFSSVCTALRAWLFSSASERVVARLRKNLFSHLINQVKVIYYSLDFMN